MEITELIGMLGFLVGLPWLLLHYITRWKTAATLTSDDEDLLEDLYQMARKLDARMDTVERLVRSDDPDWRPTRQLSADEEDRLIGDHSVTRLEKKLRERTAR